MNLQEIGFTQEELQERVIDRICDRLMLAEYQDEDGEPFIRSSTFQDKLNTKIRERIDASIAALAERHVLPNATEYIEKLTLQQTNKWGEKTGQPVTFIEYLTQRGEAYLTEEVSFEGKAKGQDSYNWRGAQTRLTYLVNNHIQYSIETAMKEAAKSAYGALGSALAETAKIQLRKIAENLKVGVINS